MSSKKRPNYQAVFASPEGQQVLLDICNKGFVSRTTYVVNDPQQTFLNEGSRRLALSILRAAGLEEHQLMNNIQEALIQKYNG